MEPSNKSRICCAIIECAYMLGLPKSYPHDVAHTCVNIMEGGEGVRFVIGYRDCGAEYIDTLHRLDTYRKMFGPMALYVFLPNEDSQSSKWTPYKAIPVDETAAHRYLLGLTLYPE